MMRSLIFWLLLPIVLPQALWVRRTAPRFAGAAGPNEGTVGEGRRRKLLAIGDSIIAGVGATCLSKALVGQTSLALSELLSCEIRWSALGRSGARSGTLLDEFLPKLEARDADFILVSIGVNDVTSLTSQTAWRRNLGDLLAALSRMSPAALIAVAGIPPLGGFPLLPQPLRAMFGFRGTAFDRAAQRVVADFPNAVYVPIDFETSPDKFSADGFHPSEPSYRVFGQAMAAQIAEKLNGRPEI